MEHGQAEVPKGYVFYFGSRRREEVIFTPELQARTLQAIQYARQLIAQGKPPPPLENYAKCRDCSLEPICLPREMRKLKETKI
jgi:CRISPR-associated exonuclease Cas4